MRRLRFALEFAAFPGRVGVRVTRGGMEAVEDGGQEMEERGLPGFVGAVHRDERRQRTLARCPADGFGRKPRS